MVSLLSIRLLLRYFKTNNRNPFDVYCALFGTAMAIYLSIN